MARIIRQRIHEQVVQHLKQHIVEQALQPGDQLPTEIELARELGIGRQAVREGLRVLEGFGIVECKPGTGTRVSSPGMAAVAEHLRFSLDVHGISVVEMWRARRALECGVLAEVAESATERDFECMDAAIECARALSERGQSIAPADLEFHVALLAATHNRALQGLGGMLHDFFPTVRSTSVIVLGERRQAIDEHERIVRALRARDVGAAQRAMWKHFSQYERLAELLGPKTPCDGDAGMRAGTRCPDGVLV